MSQAHTPPYSKDVESIEEEKRISSTNIATLDTTNKDLAGFHFDPVVEKKLRRKIDLYIVPTVALLYLFCFIDRANIGNARLAGLEKDLGMNPKSYQYNILLSSFYISYFVFELPSTMCTKIFGPAKWIPFITFMFGLLSMATAFVTSYSAAIAVRFLLGIAEAGMLPSIAFYLSRWYRKDELAFRLAMYIVMAPGAGAFGGILASGILKIDSIGSVERWEMIFLVEGIITMGLAVIGYFTLTDNITAARWLSPEEKELAINRMKSEMVGQTQLVDKARLRSVWKGVTSPTSLACALMFLMDNITVQGVAFFLPSIVRTLYPGKTVIQQQLLTVPPNVVGAAGVLIIAYLTTKFKVRSYFIMLCALFMLTGYAMFLGSKDLNVRYAASFVTCIGAFAQGAMLPAYASINSNNDSEKAGAIGVVVMFGNLGGLIATWTYLPKDAPNYVPGNALNCAAGAGVFVLAALLLVWQKRQNSLREQGKLEHRLDGKSAEEISVMGSDHPHFRFRY